MTQDGGVVIGGSGGYAVVPLERVLGIMHPRQRAAYRFVCEFWASHHYSPSVAEVGAAIGVKPPLARYHLLRLERVGLIEHTPHTQRTIRLVPLAKVA